MKRILGVPPWHGNHDACEELNLPTFVHFLNSKIVSYLFSLVNSFSSCVRPLRYYFRYNSFILSNTAKIFKNQYNVENLLDNDIMALRSRISFIDMHEERSNYFYPPPIS